MTLETFFEKFNQFADAPDAVTKMRELVLELAVQGKLVEQRDDDVRDRYWLELARQLDSEASGVDIEPPFQIPGCWRWATLERLGDTKPRNEAPGSAKSSFVPMALIPAEYGQAPRHEVRPWSEIKKGYSHFQNGDVVMAKITPCFENGKSGVMNGLTGGFGAGTTELHVFRRIGTSVLPEFAVVYLKTSGFITRGIPRMTGSAGQKRVPSDYFAGSPFPLPPPAEQRRIVAKVDELMALCDRLEAQQQDREARHAVLARAVLARFADAPTPANLQLLFQPYYAISPGDLRKTIFTLAVQGKLVAQDPNDEPVDKLFASVTSERLRFADRHKFRASAAEPVDESVVPFDIPATWKWCRLTSIFNAVTDGDHLPPPKSEEGIAFLTIGNITTGRLEFEGSRFVPEAYYQGLAEFRRPVRGDILYTVVGATYGRPALVESNRPFCVQRHIAILKPPQRIEVGFLMTVLRSPLAYDQARASTTGTAQPTIPLGSLRNFVVPLPPLAEQRRIVAKVDELMALVDELEAQLAASRATAANLLDAVVAELTSAEQPVLARRV